MHWITTCTKNKLHQAYCKGGLRLLFVAVLQYRSMIMRSDLDSQKRREQQGRLTHFWNPTSFANESLPFHASCSSRHGLQEHPPATRSSWLLRLWGGMVKSCQTNNIERRVEANIFRIQSRIYLSKLTFPLRRLKDKIKSKDLLRKLKSLNGSARLYRGSSCLSKKLAWFKNSELSKKSLSFVLATRLLSGNAVFPTVMTSTAFGSGREVRDEVKFRMKQRLVWWYHLWTCKPWWRNFRANSCWVSYSLRRQHNCKTILFYRMIQLHLQVVLCLSASRTRSWRWTSWIHPWQFLVSGWSAPSTDS